MSTARSYTVHGKSLTMRQWAKELELPQKTLRNRLDRGWTPEATFTPGKQLHRGSATGAHRIDHGRVRVVIARNLRYVYSCGCTRAHPRAKGNEQNTQPCWSCRKYAGECSWPRKYPEPVEGWEATPTTKYQGTAGEITPFAIHYCPEYVSDGTEGQG